MSAVPAVVAALVLLTYALRPLQAYRPSWSKAFVAEPKQCPDDLAAERRTQPRPWPHLLLAVSLVGFALQATSVFVPVRELLAVFPSLTWVSLEELEERQLTALKCVVAAIVWIERPRQAPISVLVILVLLFIAQLVALIHTRSAWQAEHVLSPIALLATACGVALVFSMPLRDPALPRDGISPPFTSPTDQLRSPEDNLTPWQYMTVSWMAPIISLGSQRQLNDDDVWDLAYEFKHQRLHSAFRTLRGSVTRRLLEANGIDLVIITVLGLVELAAGALVAVDNLEADPSAKCCPRQSCYSAFLSQWKIQMLPRTLSSHMLSCRCLLA